ncbi:MAG TPA: beta-ketoacyl-[acyl-carrier-protein] synthase family protein [Candidatus Omnitrophota bacterium]|nr:beta-ketoacyl-[acyl-carrier-protein] synthase family protein [Candidatus Omnitrophota bacterium]
MPATDIAITGLGAISAAGNNTQETLANFSSGRRNGGPVTLFKTELNYPAFQVQNFSPLKPEAMRSLNLAFYAAEQAISDAGLENGFGSLRIGICLGTTVASQLNDTDFYRQYRQNQTAPMDSVERYLKSNLAYELAKFFKIRAQLCTTIVNACSSGTDAIGVGLSWLRNDYCDLVIAGGADELNRVPLDGFGCLSVVSKSLCAPFDRNRSGLNLGEGAGIVILEKTNLACKRGKTPALFLNGYGQAADAYHLTAPRPDGSGLKQALEQALKQAEIQPEDITFINAHGTATKDNDLVEGKTLAKVFGPQIKFLSTKGFTGHTLGAAGGLEAVFTCLGLRENWIPANAGFQELDPEIGIAPVNQITQIKGNYAVSTSLAFGGNNSALIFAKN